MKSFFQYVLCFGVLSVFLSSCEPDLPDFDESVNQINSAEIVQPSNNSKAVCGQTIALKIKVNYPDSIQSISIYWNDSLFQNIKKITKEIQLEIPTKSSKVGKSDLKMLVLKKNGKEEEDNRSVVLFSDIFADILVARIQKTYPHNKTSYTQGLEFYKGNLYEGTGLVGQSILANVNLSDGSFIKKIDLPNTVFGEGITLLNDKIYQLTWQARVCYEYDATTFEKIREFSYFGEGWGLCNNGKEIIMSNGTSEICFLDPVSFKELRSINVFDSNKEYISLNELEYVDGILYANVYQENFILKIDPTTGKVLAKIDCSELVKKGKDLGDVLNGIAYNKQTNKMYLTGKQWPKLFEVRFEAP